MSDKFISGTTYQGMFFGELLYYSYCVYCGGDVHVETPKWENFVCPNPMCRRTNYNTPTHKPELRPTQHALDGLKQSRNKSRKLSRSKSLASKSASSRRK